MKLLVVLAMVAAARCTVVPVAVPVVGETGESAQFRSEDNLGNYNFGYNEDHTTGGTFRREVGDAHGNVAGSYGLRDLDGRIRIVNYVANDDGFKVDIKSNEPGVEPKDPADATINKAESVLVQTVAAPLLAAPSVKTAHVEQVAVQAPVTYTFPEPEPVPVAKTVVTKSEPVVHPVTYTFPEPAAVPVAKTAGTPVAYAVAEPVSYATVQQEETAGPSTKTVTTVTKQEAVPYVFPQPAAVPVAKSVPVAEPVVSYAFPARTLAQKSSVVVAPAYSSSQVRLASAPEARLAYSLPLRYAYSPYVHGSAFRYAAPYYNSLYSPMVSTFAGPVPYFGHIQYPGYTLLKK